jgi:hypothetical protein
MKLQMSARLICGLVASIGLAPGSVLAAQLVISNPSFEDFDITAGQFTVNGSGLPGWTITPATGTVGVWDPAGGAGLFSFIPDPDQIALTHAPTLSQVLPDVLTAGTTYTLRAEAGRCSCQLYAGYSVQLWAGGVLLAKEEDAQAPAPGDWISAVVTYIAAPDDPNLGSPLEIRLAVTDPTEPSETEFDHVRLSAVSDVPALPTWGYTLLLCALLLAGPRAIAPARVGSVFSSRRR